MASNDQTAVLPRLRPPPADPARRRVDGWDVDRPAAPARVTGSAPVEGGLVGEYRALARLSWLLPTITMAVVALVRTTWANLSADELGLWGYAVTPWPRAWRLLPDLDPVAAPYHVLIKGWASVFGTSDFALRVPSVLAMTAAAGLVAALGTRLAGPRAGFLAGLLCAALPATSRYAQEVGPQALSTCLVALSTVTLVRVLDRPRFWRYAGYFVSVALLSLFGAAGLLVLIAHGAAVLAMRRRAIFGWFVAVLLGLSPVAGLLYLWGLPRLRLDWTSPADLPDLAGLPEQLFGLALVGGAMVGLGLLSVSLRKPGIIFTTWALVPVLALFGAAQLSPVWDPRHLLFTVPAWALLGAMALERAPVVRGTAAIATVALLCLPTQVDIRQRDGHGQDAAAAGALITADMRPGDAIVYGPTAGDGRVGRDIIARYVPADRQPIDALATRAPRTDGQVFAEECVDVIRCLANAPRVWLLRAGPPPAAQPGQPGADPLVGLPAAKDGALRSAYDVERSWAFTGLSVTRFVLKPTAPAPLPVR